MITFDPKTLANWDTKAIKTISIEFIMAGCEGTSIVIHENIVLDNSIHIGTLDNGVNLYALPENRQILENAYLSWNGSDWILKSESILTRCRCGRSFGIKTGDIKLDKIQLLKSKLKKKNHH